MSGQMTHVLTGGGSARGRLAKRTLTFVGFMLVLLALAPALASATPLFTQLSGEMVTRRYMPAAATLPNGEVLVASGRNTETEKVPLTSAELFNPATGSFQALAAKSLSDRSEPAYASLPDGSVLIAGGDTYAGKTKKELNTGAIFNPATSSFEAIASHMATPRVGATAALLSNGKVLIVGGYQEPTVYLASAELYDPATRTFTAVPGTLAAGQYAPVAAPLPGGRALVVGGYSKSGKATAAASIFNAATNTFESLTGAGHELVEPLSEAAAVELANGNVLVIGGYNEPHGNLRSVELFSWETNTFQMLPTQLVDERDGPAAALLADGRVLVVGGYSEAATEPERWLSTAEMRGVEPPSATTGAASAVGTAGATLSGTAVSETQSSSFFQYGTTTGYGAATGTQTTVASTGAVAFSAAVSGLAPNTTYHYRAVSAQAGGTSYGGDRTFTTAPVPPTLSGVSQSNRRWRAGGALASLSRRRAPLGTTFSFGLDQAATVTTTFTQSVGGRKVKGRCVPRTRRNRHRHACKRTLTRGVLTFAGHAGLDKIAFQGRLSSGRRLKPGTYAVLIAARNAAGQSSAVQKLTFTIVR